MEINNYTDVPHEPKELVELLAMVYMGMATAENPMVSSAGAYSHLEGAIKDMIGVAYPKVPAERVFMNFVETAESIAANVKYTQKEICWEESDYVAVEDIGASDWGIPEIGDMIYVPNAGGTYQSPGRYGYSRTQVLDIETRDDLGYRTWRVETAKYGWSCWHDTKNLIVKH